MPEVNRHQDEEDIPEETKETNLLNNTEFFNQFHPHERPFLELALHLNPVIADVETAIQNMLQRLNEMVKSSEHLGHIQDIRINYRQNNLVYIRRRIKKDVRCSVHPQFELWLEEENDENVIFHLTLLISLKLYTRDKAYIRYRILWDRLYRDEWRNKTLEM